MTHYIGRSLGGPLGERHFAHWSPILDVPVSGENLMAMRQAAEELPERAVRFHVERYRLQQLRVVDRVYQFWLSDDFIPGTEASREHENKVLLSLIDSTPIDNETIRIR